MKNYNELNTLLWSIIRMMKWKYNIEKDDSLDLHDMKNCKKKYENNKNKIERPSQDEQNLYWQKIS